MRFEKSKGEDRSLLVVGNVVQLDRTKYETLITDDGELVEDSTEKFVIEELVNDGVPGIKLQGVFGYFTVTEKEGMTHVPRRIVESLADLSPGDRVRVIHSRHTERWDTLYEVGTEHEILLVRGDSYVESKGPTSVAISSMSDGMPFELIDEFGCATVNTECPTLSIETKTDVLFGCDYECFIQDTRTGLIVPAGVLIPGTKANPHELENGVCHPDGIALEVAFPPCSTGRELHQNLDKVLEEVKQKYFPEEYYELLHESEVRAEQVQHIERHRKEHPEWFISGCAHELTCNINNTSRGYVDVYRKTKERVQDMFFAGLHIHIGFTEWDDTAVNRIDAAHLIQQVAHILPNSNKYVGQYRQRSYGGYGCFRMKPYGVEFRQYGAGAKDGALIERICAKFKTEIKKAGL